MRAVIVMLLIAAGVVLSFSALPAEAHSWYDLHCCSDKDCAPAAAGTVTWTPAGWSVSATHEVVPFDDPRIRYTPPGAPQFHICKLPNANVLRCLYLPEPEG